MYSITNFNKSNGDMTFTNPYNGKTHTINVLRYLNYLSVNHQHYYNKELNEVILVKEALQSFRPFVLNNMSRPKITDENNVTYYACQQWEFDKWHLNDFPTSDNAKVYNLLMEKLN